MADTERVCVVAGAGAWPFYLDTNALVCPENRPFAASWLAFYSGRQIQGLVPRVLRIVASVELSPASAARLALSGDPEDRRIGIALATALHAGTRVDRVEVVLLSGAGDADTVAIEPVPHEGDSAWTVFQRYADLGALRRAATTADLDGVP
jgi:hypothetical protein